MVKSFLDKLKESFLSVISIYLLILILALTPLINLSFQQIMLFTLATALIIFGIALFNVGADVAMTPMGKQIGGGLTKQGRLGILILVVFLMGLFITMAEPDLSVLATQTESVFANKWLLIIGVALGVALFLMIAVFRILKKFSLINLLTYFYMLIFSIAILIAVAHKEAALPLAFDSGGVTTGPITVPFLMALGVGISGVISSKSEKDASFGFVALSSVGPILIVLLLVLFSSSSLPSGDEFFNEAEYVLSSNVAHDYFSMFLSKLGNVGIAILLIAGFFLIIDLIFLKINKKKLVQLGVGVLLTYIGLVIFLSAAEVFYLPIGYEIGTQLAALPEWVFYIIAFVIGALTVLAEPAIHILIKQVEEVTNGIIKRNTLLAVLSIGVGSAITLSLVRIKYGFSILYYLIPVYAIASPKTTTAHRTTEKIF